MSHGSGGLDRSLCAASEGITEHTLQARVFFFFCYLLIPGKQMITYESNECHGPVPAPCLTPGAGRSVTFPTAVAPVCDLPHSPKRIRLQSSSR